MICLHKSKEHEFEEGRQKRVECHGLNSASPNLYFEVLNLLPHHNATVFENRHFKR
jgi:hypothetical protein